MNASSRIALLPVLLLTTTFAFAAIKNNHNTRITVVDAETHSVALAGSDIPRNCDQVNYDAYCNSSKTALLTNTLLVRDEEGQTFHVTCTNDSKFSRCMPLPKGESFDAKKEKRGIVVYYEDDKGKVRSQLYTYVAGETQGNPQEPAPAPASQPVPSTVAAAQAPAAQHTPPVPASLQETVKCSFSSTPSGADITLDGQYTGSTPSVLSLTIGNHVIVIATPGFAEWKREMTVSPGSELTVNAVLEKAK